MLSTSNLNAREQAISVAILLDPNKVPPSLAEYYQWLLRTEDREIVVENMVLSHCLSIPAAKELLDLHNAEKSKLRKRKKVIEGQKRSMGLSFDDWSKQQKYVQPWTDQKRDRGWNQGLCMALDIPNEEVIACYHQLFQVEAAFRIAK